MPQPGSAASEASSSWAPSNGGWSVTAVAPAMPQPSSAAASVVSSSSSSGSSSSVGRRRRRWGPRRSDDEPSGESDEH
eukprot:4073564-Pyramimonas_sp.AAC.1